MLIFPLHHHNAVRYNLLVILLLMFPWLDRWICLCKEVGLLVWRYSYNFCLWGQSLRRFNNLKGTFWWDCWNSLRSFLLLRIFYYDLLINIPNTPCLLTLIQVGRLNILHTLIRSKSSLWMGFIYRFFYKEIKIIDG